MEKREERQAEQVGMRHEQTTPYGSYALLIALFNALFGGFIYLYRRTGHPLDRITPLDLGLLGLATLRTAKLVSEDEITAVLRKPLVDGVREHGGGHGQGLRWALGKLVLCPTCSGTWVAALLTYALHLSPRYTRPFLAMMSASGAEQLSDALLSLVYTDRDVLRERSASRR